MTVDHVERIMSLLRSEFHYVVVDLGSRVDPRSVAMLEHADANVFVLFPEIAALRSMSLLLAFLADTTPLRARTSIVVNHVFPKELLKTRDVENLLRAKPAAEIPYTEVDMIRSVNEGVPLVIGRPASPATLAMHRLAQAVIGIEQQCADRRQARAAEHLQPQVGRAADAPADCGWCRRRDSNPHAFRPPGLSRLRLPFRHSGAVSTAPRRQG